jgi:prepilin-type N-terminal cleavage/methylation domain-containing protein
MSDNFPFYSSIAKKGFTMIELLIVMGLFIIVLSFGIAIGLDSFRANNLIAEKSSLISALQKARSQAINNVGNSGHGFSFDGANYIIFEGASFGSRNWSRDLIIPKSSSITISGFTEVVFEQLTGDASPAPCNIILSEGISSSSISVNEEGRIDW